MSSHNIQRIEHVRAGDIVWLRSRARWRRALVVRPMKKNVQVACKTKDGGVYTTKVGFESLYADYSDVTSHLASEEGRWDRDTPFSDCLAPELQEVP